jgi:protein-S-isoprenylcysteine O-methyltransferase Ste14
MIAESTIHSRLILLEIGIAAITLIALMFVVAPYGRHIRKGWGPSLPPIPSWVLMELPAVVAFLFFYITGHNNLELVPLILLGLWQIHYLHRTFIFPLRMHLSNGMPLSIFIAAISFNTLNAYINARWISHLSNYGTDWVTDYRFLIGCTLFVLAWVGNIHADTVLRNLRNSPNTRYKIPYGGLYRWVSCPNYLCEILEWIGWAIASWSPAGLAFAIYTIANLLPRSISHQRWYHKQFEKYPKTRKALIPYIL